MAIKQVGNKMASIISRKTAKAIVTESSNSGIFINNKTIVDYFKQERFIQHILRVLEYAELDLNINVKTFGGGISGQADAIRCALARYIIALFPDKINAVKCFMKIDNRVVERKKYGCYKARKGYVFRRR